MADTLAFARRLRSQPNWRGNSWLVYIRFRQLLADARRTADEGSSEFVDRLCSIVKRRMDRMDEEGDYNPITVELYQSADRRPTILEPYINAKEFTVRLDAVTAVESLRLKPAVGRLVTMLRHEEHPFVISKLTKVIGTLGDEKVLQVLVPFLEHEDVRVRANTVKGIGRIDGESRYPVLVRMLDDESARVRASALYALRRMDEGKLAKLIGIMASAPEAHLRQGVLYLLAPLRDTPLARETLMKLADDTDDDISGRATDMLASYPTVEVLDKLIPVVYSEAVDKDRRIRVLSALEKMKPADEELKVRVGHAVTDGRRILGIPAEGEDDAQSLQRKKAMHRLNNALRELVPRDRFAAKLLIDQGQIRNVSHLRRWLLRREARKKAKG